MWRSVNLAKVAALFREGFLAHMVRSFIASAVSVGRRPIEFLLDFPPTEILRESGQQYYCLPFLERGIPQWVRIMQGGVICTSLH